MVKDEVMICDPVNDLVPDQPLEAKQELALDEVQERVNDSPWLIVVLSAVKSTVGAAGG